MNVGYSNGNHRDDVVCPLCGSDVRISKYGFDYRCVNKECLLFRNSHVVIKEILSILEKEVKE